MFIFIEWYISFTQEKLQLIYFKVESEVVMVVSIQQTAKTERHLDLTTCNRWRQARKLDQFDPDVSHDAFRKAPSLGENDICDKPYGGKKDQPMGVPVWIYMYATKVVLTDPALKGDMIQCCVYTRSRFCIDCALKQSP